MAVLTEPAGNLAAVTKSDTTVFDIASRGIWVGGAGDIAVKTTDGQTVTIVGVVAGTLLPIRVTQVLETGTSATNIVRMW